MPESRTVLPEQARSATHRASGSGRSLDLVAGHHDAILAPWEIRY